MIETIGDTKKLGELIRKRRQEQGLRQPDLAMVSGVGVRFIVNLEHGKETCQIGLALKVLQALGIHLVAEEGGSLNVDNASEMPTGIKS